jgi:hypothetical protein
MNRQAEQQLLLDDVLGESAPPDFRAALLAGTLRQARRRRRWRRARQSAGACGVLLLAVWLVWRHQPSEISANRPPVRPGPASAYQLVATQPLPAGAVVKTKTDAAIITVSSDATVTQIASSSAGFRYIGDAELLALAGPGQAVLIRTGPDSEELVFASAANSSPSHPAN